MPDGAASISANSRLICRLSDPPLRRSPAQGRVTGAADTLLDPSEILQDSLGPVERIGFLATLAHLGNPGVKHLDHRRPDL